MKQSLYIFIGFIFMIVSCKHAKSDTNKAPETPGNRSVDQSSSLEEILRSVSKEAIALGDFDYSAPTISSQWLGFPPATAAQIEEVENRLKIKLPEEYINFVHITNGFQSTSAVHPTFHSVDRIDYLINIEPYLVEIWNQEGTVEIGKKMARSIIVGGINEEQHFLLIPPLEGEQWEFWSFASWYPGEAVHPDIKTFWLEMNDFLKGSNE